LEPLEAVVAAIRAAHATQQPTWVNSTFEVSFFFVGSFQFRSTRNIPIGRGVYCKGSYHVPSLNICTCAPPRTALAMRRRPLTVLVCPVRSSGRSLDLRAHWCANQWWKSVEERKTPSLEDEAGAHLLSSGAADAAGWRAGHECRPPGQQMAVCKPTAHPASWNVLPLFRARPPAFQALLLAYSSRYFGAGACKLGNLEQLKGKPSARALAARHQF